MVHLQVGDSRVRLVGCSVAMVLNGTLAGVENEEKMRRGGNGLMRTDAATGLRTRKAVMSGSKGRVWKDAERSNTGAADGGEWMLVRGSGRKPRYGRWVSVANYRKEADFTPSRGPT